MSEVDEDDKVVTPWGDIGEYRFMYDGGHLVTIGEQEHQKCEPPNDTLVKVDAPIRVSVSRDCYAESLIALAEEHGFEFGGFPSSDKGFDDISPRYPLILIFRPSEKMYLVYIPDDHDLTYAQDLPQIEGWLQANAESEYDECETCGGDKWIQRRVSLPHGEEDVRFACPDCTDESDETETVVNDVPNKPGYVSTEQETDEPEEYDNPQWMEDYEEYLQEQESGDYSEPRPDDDEWRNNLRHKLKRGEFLGTKEDLSLLDYIDDLESELQDVREDRGNWRQEAKNWRDEWDTLQERIEEARDYIKQTECGLTRFERKLLEILSDSDEGDGCV